MSKDIPEIDDLTRGINDSELILTQDSVETQVAGMTSWIICNRTVPERIGLKGLSASLTVTLRIHWTTAI